MIDKTAFMTGLAVLSGAFGREIDGAVQRAYYVVLSPRLTTEEFERAVAITLSTETFWPSPAVLLAKVKANDETEGLAAFEHVNRITSKHGGYRFLPNDVYHAEFDRATRAAISSVGGLHAIANTTDNHWSALQRKFAAAYAAALHPQPQIAAPPEEPIVKQLVRDTALAMSGRDRATGEYLEDDE